MTDTHTSSIVTFGVFQANLRTGELTKAGLRIRIQEQPFKILAALLEKPNEVVTREELRQRIWPRESFGDFDHAIDLAVGKLRTALGDSASAPRFVETLPRRGYRFIAPASWADSTGIERSESTAESLTPGPETVPQPAVTERSWRLWPIVAVIVLALAGIAAFRSQRNLPGLRPGSVLVAHFENRTGEPALDDTLEYALRRELGNSELLKVVPSERVEDALRLMKKGGNTPLDAATAREVCLRDGTIQELITGQVEKLGSVYLLSATIVDAATGVILRSVSDEADSMTTIPTAVRRLSNQVRSVAGESLAQIKESNARMEQATTPSLRALQLYSQGMVFVNEERWGPAAELLEQAVQADPDFASAHVYLAYCYGNVGNNKPADLHFKRAYELADTATDRERYFILGSYYDRIGQVERAIQSYEVLVQLYPDHYWGESNLLFTYVEAKRYGDAAAEAKRQAELRPNDFLANLRAGRSVERWMKDPDAARPYYEAAERLITREIQERYPESAELAFVNAHRFLREGNPGLALAEADRMAASYASLLAGQYKDAWLQSLADLYLNCGKIALAEHWYRQVSDEGEKHFALVSVAGARGDHEEMRRQLRQQFASGADLGPGTAALLAQSGMMSAAHQVLSRLEKQGSPDSGWLMLAENWSSQAAERSRVFESCKVPSNYTGSNLMPTATWQPLHLRRLWIAREGPVER